MLSNRNEGTITKYKVRQMPFIYETTSSPRAESTPGPNVRKLGEPQTKKKTTRVITKKSLPS
jgi:hypothetical protein